MNKTAIIIGATGTMGEEFSRLLSKSYNTIGTTRISNYVTLCHKTIYVPDLSFSSCNIIIKEIKKSYTNIDLIIYNAGFAYNEDFITNKIKKEILEVNTSSVITLCKNFPEAKFVYMSSCATLGTNGTKNLETYVLSKRLSENFLKHYCKDLVLVRPSIIPDTRFFERAKIQTNSKKGFMNAKLVAQYVIKNLNKRTVFPGWQSKVLNFMNILSPRIAQKFLKI